MKKVGIPKRLPEYRKDLKEMREGKLDFTKINLIATGIAANKRGKHNIPNGAPIFAKRKYK